MEEEVKERRKTKQKYKYPGEVQKGWNPLPTATDDACRRSPLVSCSSFMSINPNDAKGPESNPSQISRSPISRPNHGSRSPPDQIPQSNLQRHRTGGGNADVADSPVPIGGEGCRYVELRSITEPVATSNEAYTEGSQILYELRKPESGGASGGFKSESHAQEQEAGTGGASSRTRSDQKRFDQNSGNTTIFASLAHSHRSTGGSKGQHGSSSQSGTRKNQTWNANHLLNFHYDPIQRSQPRMPPLKRQQKLRPFNRELFLQANYNFVVLDTGSYVVEAIDPDKMLQWEDIICLRYSSPSVVQCPICLDTPLCPQITSCGHIFCFPCIIQYLQMGKEDHRGQCWKRCPLCFMMISLKDLYTIFIDQVKQFDVGDSAHFTLMTRQKDSFVPSQVNAVASDSSSNEDDLVSSFSKFTLTSDVEMSVREARSSLDEWLVKAESGLVDDIERLPYVCAALEQLEQRAKYWDDRQTIAGSKRSHITKKDARLPVKALAHELFSNGPFKTAVPTLNNEAVIHYTSASEVTSTQRSSKNTERVPPLDKEDKVQKTGVRDAGNSDAYCFYQVIDGQQIILHPLNMKCLLHYYKSYDSLPPRISGKILQLETVTQSEATRRRYRYLSHFSLTTSFQLCEIDLSLLLPRNAFSPFLEEIKKRERQRKQVARKTSDISSFHYKAKDAGHPNISFEPVPIPEATITCGMHIPIFRHENNDATVFALDEFEALGNCTSPSTSPIVIGERKLFADVTRLGFAAAQDSPSLSTGVSRDTASSVEGIVTGPSTPTISFANILSQKKTVACQDAPKVISSEKKGKKHARVLLSTTGGRRY